MSMKRRITPRSSVLVAGAAVALVALSLLIAQSNRQGGALAVGEEVKPEALAGPWQVKSELKGAFGCPKDYDPAPPGEFSLKMMEMPEMEGMPIEMLAFLGARYEMTAPGKFAGEATLMDFSKLPKMPSGEAGRGGSPGQSRTPIEEVTEPDEECPYSEKMGRTMAKYSKLLDFKGQVFMGSLEKEGAKEGEPHFVYSYFGKPSPLPSLKGLLMVVDQQEEKCPCTYVYEWEARRPKK